MIKRIFAAIETALIILMLASLFSGCSKSDGSGYTFRANLAENPQNLDPQLAEDSTSITVISNMFDGLVRKNQTGGIEPAAAEKYSISDDGLTYTFELKKNVYWQSVTKYKALMKADDFVFAFQRIYDAKTSFSPYKDYFGCIKNAYAVSDGKADISTLGVIAKDDFTLEITLEYPCWDFLERLTSTAAMPCNRMFFESTKGKYGLSANSCISNGAFYMKEWNFDPYWKDNYIIMRRNNINSANNFVYPYSLNFFITGDASNDSSDFSSSKTDCFITNSYNKKIMSANSFSANQTISYGLIFNLNNEQLKNISVRKALAYSVNKNQLQTDDSIETADGIIPKAVCMLGKSYRELVNDNTLYIYDLKQAKQLLNGELSDYGFRITIPESFSAADSIKSVTEQWKNELDFDCRADVVSMNEYKSQLENGNFEIALVEISATKNSPEDFLSYFSDGDAVKKCGYSNTGFNKLLFNAQKADNLSDAAEDYAKAEKMIIDDFIYIPLYYGNTYLVYSKKSTDIEFYPFENILYFRNAKNFKG